MMTSLVEASRSRDKSKPRVETSFCMYRYGNNIPHGEIQILVPAGIHGK